MLVFLVITILFLSFISLKFHFSVIGNIDLINIEGCLYLQLFGIKIFSGCIFVETDTNNETKFIFKHKKKKRKTPKISEYNKPKKKEKENALLGVIKRSLIKSVNIEKIDFTLTYGDNGNAFNTTMVVGSLKILIYSLLAMVKNKYNAEIKENFVPSFNNNAANAEFLGIFTLSIADIIFINFIEKINEYNNEKKLIRRLKKVDNRAKRTSN